MTPYDFFEWETEHSHCDFFEDFKQTTIYDELCINQSVAYDPNKSKDLYLRDHYMKYIHRFLAYSFSNHRDALRIISKIDLYFLWCML